MWNQSGTVKKKHENLPGVVQGGYGWSQDRWLQETPRRLMIQKRNVTNTGPQPSSFDPKTSGDEHGAPTNLLDV